MFFVHNKLQLPVILGMGTRLSIYPFFEFFTIVDETAWVAHFGRSVTPQGHSPILMKFLSDVMWVVYLLLKC